MATTTESSFHPQNSLWHMAVEERQDMECLLSKKFPQLFEQMEQTKKQQKVTVTARLPLPSKFFISGDTLEPSFN